MKGRPIRIGVVGCGSVLDPYMTVADPLRRRGEVELVAACGRPHQRRYVVEGLGVPSFTTDFRDVTESKDVDLVLVLTSAKDHGPITRAALEAGKHVLVEKPVSVDLEEASRIVDLARKGPGYLVCAPHVILSPTFQTIAHRLRRGDIGRVVSARARYGFSGPWWNKWFYLPGGGVLTDLACYNIATLTGLLGPARRVMAMAGVSVPEREINGERVRVVAEDNAQILLDFGDAAFAVVTSSLTMQQYRSPAVELYGSTGVIQMLGDDWDPDGYEIWRNEAGCWQVFKEQMPDWPWADGLRHLVECIREGVPPLITPEHAYHTLEVSIKAQVSAREGRAMRIESTFTPPAFTGPKEEVPAHMIHDRTRKHQAPLSASG